MDNAEAARRAKVNVEITEKALEALVREEAVLKQQMREMKQRLTQSHFEYSKAVRIENRLKAEAGL